MPPTRGRGGRGGRSRGRGGRGGQRFGRNEARGRSNAFESARIVEDEDLEQPYDDSDSEDESLASVDSSDEDEPVNRTQAYNQLLQSFGQNSSEEGPSRKRRKIEAAEGNPALSNSGSNEDERAEGTEEVADDAEDVEDDIHDDEEVHDAIDEDEDPSDPYEVHFANPEENELAARLKAVSERKWTTSRQPFGTAGGKCTVCMPDVGSKELKFIQSLPTAESLKLKKKLLSAAESILPALDGTEKSLASNVFAYRDVLFGARTVRNSANIRKVATLHALDLVFKTRDRVLKNNARLAKEDANPDLEYRDQGFTRPKVLVLLPTRHSCVRFIDTLIELSQPEQQENKKRFEDGFVSTLDPESDEYAEDYQELMQGNTDDMFRLGVKFTRKTLKFFSQFYNSDIIVASPLGLRQALEVNKSKKQDYDFLSSIELVIMDQTDALLMQNWQHVEYIFDHLNLQPQEAHGCDFSRVRNWYLDGNAKYLRQTIVLSAFITPELNTLFNKHLLNISGKVKFHPEYKGAMLNIGLPIKQTFSRLESTSIVSDPDARFKYFTTAVIPSITRYPKPPDGALGVLIFIPSYFDFVRVRNYFATSSATQNISFGSISENQSSAAREIRRARSHFLTGKHSVLLYTGRAHHFFRYKLRGVKKVVMYGLPDNPTFYQELSGGFLGTSVNEGKIGPEEAGVRVLFSKYDGLKVERIVGSERVGRLLKDKGGDTFDFI